MNSGKYKGGLFLILVFLPFMMKAIVPSAWELIAHILIKIYLNIAFGLCLWIMLQNGMLSLGQGAFIAIGAYVTGIVVAKYQFTDNLWVGYILGGGIASLTGFLLGLITVHLRRIYFLLVTWAFGEMLHPVFTSFYTPFGGASGITNIPAPQGIKIFGEPWTGYYFLALCFAFLVWLLIWSLSRSSIGLIYRSIGQNDTLAYFCGVPARRYKLQAFTIGCFLTGIGGGIVASYLTAVSPESFTFFMSLDIIMFNLIGGMGSWVGPIIGAVILTSLNEILFAIGYYKMIVYGLIIILVIRLLPGGLVSIFAMLQNAWNRTDRNAV